MRRAVLGRGPSGRAFTTSSSSVDTRRAKASAGSCGPGGSAPSHPKYAIIRLERATLAPTSSWVSPRLCHSRLERLLNQAGRGRR